MRVSIFRISVRPGNGGSVRRKISRGRRTNPLRTRRYRWGVWPKKRFGQHFLTSREVLERIADAAEIGPQDTVVEIGAGTGGLTGVIAARARRVVALELDQSLLPRLRRRFAGKPHVLILHQDALALPLPDTLRQYPRPLKIVGNLPYNVATQILMKFARFPREVDGMALMLQKEVAARLVAVPATPAYGSISLLVQLEWEVSIAFEVPPTAFHPVPKVASALALLQPLPRPQAEVGDRSVYAKLVRAAFNQRRKTLKNALRELGGGEPGWSTELLRRAGIEEGRRGETLTLEEFARLSRVAQAPVGSSAPETPGLGDGGEA